ncbi:MAG: decarboxylase, partial [Candidatus Aenigmarchaeota archaeon]|nr:decarboxylase [Candidatus Aenigmarchaeota archaeon]
MLFVLSKGIVLEQYSVVEGLADMVSYSSKTNQEVTGVLEGNTDCMFSVHFANELVYVKDMSRVWFLAQAWDKDHVLGLLGRGVRSFVVDNESDLDVFLECMK